MDIHFDYFLILSGCAFVLVIWLVIRSFKSSGARQSDDLSKRVSKATGGTPRVARTRERIGARKGSGASSVIAAKPSEPVLTTLCFTDGRSYPFAVANLSSDFWLHSEQAVYLPEKLQATLTRYLPLTESASARLLHVLDSPRAGRPIVLRGFDEKGQRWTKPLTAALSSEDFRIDAQPAAWQCEVRETLQKFYRARFRELDASDQAALIALENHPERLFAACTSHSAQRALRAQILMAILVNTDCQRYFQLINCYFLSLEQCPADLFESMLCRLTISQTFAQTQKLPFLLLSNTSSGVKCYNALNY